MPRSRTIRPILAATLAAALAGVVHAQAPASGRWACSANGKDVDITIANDQATVVVAGQQRVLKRQEISKGTLYTDGTVALRQRGLDPVTQAQFIENGTAATLERCLPVAG